MNKNIKMIYMSLLLVVAHGYASVEPAIEINVDHKESALVVDGDEKIDWLVVYLREIHALQVRQTAMLQCCAACLCVATISLFFLREDVKRCI